MKLEFSRTIFEAVPCRQTDRHDQANIRSSKFFQRS